MVLHVARFSTLTQPSLCVGRELEPEDLAHLIILVMIRLR